MTHSFKPDELLEPKVIEDAAERKLHELHLMKVSGLIQELAPADLAEVFEGLPIALKRKINWLTTVKDNG